MKLSPVQLLQLTFRKISVELDERHCPSDPPNPLLAPLSLHGVELRTALGFSEREPPLSPSRRVYQLDIELLVDNVVIQGRSGQRFSPYRIDIKAAALIEVATDAPQYGAPRDLAMVNGAALMWSALREQVTVVTSRMPMGPVQLPTVHFLDLLETPDGPTPSAKASSTGATKASRRPKAPAGR